MNNTLLKLAIICIISVFSSISYADNGRIRISLQPGLNYLPVYIVQNEKLLEKHAVRLGITNPTVEWVHLTSTGAATDAMISGNLDVIGGAPSNLFVIWSRTGGQVKAITATSEVPFGLITRNASVQSIADFGPTDRIAVPTIKVSIQAIYLQMALEKLYGEGGETKLDSNMVQLGNSDATIAIANPDGEVNSHFAVPPFLQRSLKNPAFHMVLSSNEIVGGKATSLTLYAMERFGNDNPRWLEAIVAAVSEAQEIIEADTERAAEIYVAASQDGTPVDDIKAILDDPLVSYSSIVPLNTLDMAQFMHRTGLIDSAPANWREYTFPILHDKSEE